jgi:hypothetical protein
LTYIGCAAVGCIAPYSGTETSLLGDYLALLQPPPGAPSGLCAGDDNPFGGTIPIEGDFNPKPSGVFDPVNGSRLPGQYPIIYQVWITPPSGPKFQLLNSFSIGVQPIGAPLSDPIVPITQTAIPPYGPVSVASGPLYYTYYESGDGQVVTSQLLASFQAGGLPEGNYTVEIDGFNWNGAAYQPITSESQTFYVYNGHPPKDVPSCTLSPTSAAECGNIAVGATITGVYRVTDEFFGSVSVVMTQVSLGGVPLAMPTVVLSDANNGPDSVVYDGTNTTGTSGTFTIDTSGLPPCGYTVQLTAWDRALLSPDCVGHESQTAFGFCLVAN